MDSHRDGKRKSSRTLGSLLRYFISCELCVELKTGKIYRGILDASDDSMSLTLLEATTIPFISSHQSKQLETQSQRQYSLLSIRGSQIRYIHFPDDLNLSLVIKQGMERESAARKQYQRQLRGSK